MIAGSNTDAVVLGTEPAVSGVSWPAVIAGAVAAMALTLVLLTLGTGLGLAVVSPWGNEGVSATTFHIASGIYLLVVATMASAVGGYVAGRLRTKWTGVHTDEVYFRDTAHGFLAWALASVVGAGLLAAAASGIVNSTVMGASQGGATAAGASASGGMTDVYVDRLLRMDTAAPAAGAATPAPSTGTPANANADDTRAELSRLLTPSFQRGGEVGSADRTYLARVVSSRTGLSQADAEKRVNEVLTQAKAAADEARKAAIKAALWMTAALLLGAFAASLAATEGGGLRDGTWIMKR